MEPGYLAHINCSYDPTMPAAVELVSTTSDGWSWYYAREELPNGSREGIVMPEFGDSEVVALLGNPYNGRNMWGIVTGQNASAYQSLNLTVREVFFDRRDFRVEVYPTQRLINVTVKRRPCA